MSVIEMSFRGDDASTTSEEIIITPNGNNNLNIANIYAANGDLHFVLTNGQIFIAENVAGGGEVTAGLEYSSTNW